MTHHTSLPAPAGSALTSSAASLVPPTALEAVRDAGAAAPREATPVAFPRDPALSAVPGEAASVAIPRETATVAAVQASAPVALALPRPVVEKGYPIVGLVPSMLRDAPGTLLRAARRHPGEVFSIRLGPVQIPIVTEPEHVQEVLIDNARDFIKSGMYDAARPMLGQGLVTSDGELWRKQRRLIQPFFNQKHLSSLSELMVGAIGSQLDLLARRTRNGAPVDFGEEMALVTQRVLMESMFGSSIDPEEALSLGRHLAAGFKAMNYRTFLYFLPAWMPRPGDRTFFRSIAAIDKVLARLVAERRAKPTETVDILNQFLAARDADTGEPMSDRQIRDELITLFVAGLDTTALTLTWMTWLLEAHPEADARLRAEVAAVVGDRRPGMADLPRLTYTRLVVQESMRLYPAGWIIPRYAAEGTVVGGRSIAPGTSLLVCPYVSHRNPAYWDDPDGFDPDRFTPERSAGRPKLAYYPFGAGSRQCVGSHFAMIEAQLATVMLVQRFKPRLVPGQRVVPASAGTLTPKHRVKMILDPA